MSEENIKHYLKTIELLKNKNYPEQYDKIIKTLLATIDVALHGAGGQFYTPTKVLIEINVELLTDKTYSSPSKLKIIDGVSR